MNRRILRPFLLGILFLAWAGGALAGQSRDEIMGRAQARYREQDMKGAIADFTELIGRNKQDGEAFYWRACARHALGEVDDAILDYSWAIGLLQAGGVWGENGKFWLAQLYTARGKAKHDLQDWAGAIADYDAALALKADDPITLRFRVYIRQITGDLQGAMEDSEGLIRLLPNKGDGYQQRAVTRWGKGDFPGAIADFREVIRREPDHVTYSQFFIWCLRARLDEKAAADEGLVVYMKALPASTGDDWERQVAAFLLGRLEEKEFMAASASPEAMRQRARLCEAWYYRGVKALLAGDRRAAQDCFRQSEATGMIHFTEYILARMELKGGSGP